MRGSREQGVEDRRGQGAGRQGGRGEGSRVQGGRAGGREQGAEGRQGAGDQKLQYLSAKMQNSMFFVNFTKCF